DPAALDAYLRSPDKNSTSSQLHQQQIPSQRLEKSLSSSIQKPTYPSSSNTMPNSNEMRYDQRVYSIGQPQQQAKTNYTYNTNNTNNNTNNNIQITQNTFNINSNSPQFSTTTTSTPNPPANNIIVLNQPNPQNRFPQQQQQQQQSVQSDQTFGNVLNQMIGSQTNVNVILNQTVIQQPLSNQSTEQPQPQQSQPTTNSSSQQMVALSINGQQTLIPLSTLTKLLQQKYNNNNTANASSSSSTSTQLHQQQAQGVKYGLQSMTVSQSQATTSQQPQQNNHIISNTAFSSTDQQKVVDSSAVQIQSFVSPHQTSHNSTNNIQPVVHYLQQNGTSQNPPIGSMIIQNTSNSLQRSATVTNPIITNNLRLIRPVIDAKPIINNTVQQFITPANSSLQQSQLQNRTVSVSRQQPQLSTPNTQQQFRSKIHPQPNGGIVLQLNQNDLIASAPTSTSSLVLPSSIQQQQPRIVFAATPTVRKQTTCDNKTTNIINLANLKFLPTDQQQPNTSVPIQNNVNRSIASSSSDISNSIRLNGHINDVSSISNSVTPVADLLTELINDLQERGKEPEMAIMKIDEYLKKLQNQNTQLNDKDREFFERIVRYRETLNNAVEQAKLDGQHRKRLLDATSALHTLSSQRLIPTTSVAVIARDQVQGTVVVKASTSPSKSFLPVTSNGSSTITQSSSSSPTTIIQLPIAKQNELLNNVLKKLKFINLVDLQTNGILPNELSREQKIYIQKLEMQVAQLPVDKQQQFIHSQRDLVPKYLAKHIGTSASTTINLNSKTKILFGTPSATTKSLRITSADLLNQQLKKDHNAVLNPDFKSKFLNRTDAIKRLTRYHIYQKQLPNDPTVKECQQFDESFECVSSELLLSIQNLKEKYSKFHFSNDQFDNYAHDSYILEKLHYDDMREEFENEKSQAAERTKKRFAADIQNTPTPVYPLTSTTINQSNVSDYSTTSEIDDFLASLNSTSDYLSGTSSQDFIENDLFTDVLLDPNTILPSSNSYLFYTSNTNQFDLFDPDTTTTSNTTATDETQLAINSIMDFDLFHQSEQSSITTTTTTTITTTTTTTTTMTNNTQLTTMTSSLSTLNETFDDQFYDNTLDTTLDEDALAVQNLLGYS
ncbi:unnamed protein product, partial [Didymodactylos carnosus]